MRVLRILLAASAPALVAAECTGISPRDPVEPPSGGYSAGYGRSYDRVVDRSERALFELEQSGMDTAEIARATALVKEAAGSLHRMTTFVDETATPAVNQVSAEYDELGRRLENYQVYSTTETARRLRHALDRVRDELAPGLVPLALNRPVEPLPAPDIPPIDVPPQPPAPPGPTIQAPARVFYLAWVQSHQGLVRDVQEGRDAQRSYGEVIDLLIRFRDAMEPAARPAVDPYVAQYRRLWDRTLGFQSYSTEFSRADAAGELDRIRSAVETLAPAP